MRRTLRQISVGVLASIGLLYIIVTVTPLTEWWGRALAGPWRDPDGDVLVLLGSDAPNGGVIGMSSYWRAVYGVRAWRDGHFKKVLISGGSDIAYSMRQFLMCGGVAGSDVQVEPLSTSTRENALFSRDALNAVPGSKILLTSDFHMYRAVRVFRRAGIEVIPRPFPDVIKRSGDWRTRWPAFIDLMTETIKIAWYKAHGWM